MRVVCVHLLLMLLLGDPLNIERGAFHPLETQTLPIWQGEAFNPSSAFRQPRRPPHLADTDLCNAAGGLPACPLSLSTSSPPTSLSLFNCSGCFANYTVSCTACLHTLLWSPVIPWNSDSH
jgi:hypothetical protein